MNREKTETRCSVFGAAFGRFCDQSLQNEGEEFYPWSVGSNPLAKTNFCVLLLQ